MRRFLADALPHVILALFSAMSRLADPDLGRGEWPRHATTRWDY